MCKRSRNGGESENKVIPSRSLPQTKQPVTSPACAGATPDVFAAEAGCYAGGNGAALREPKSGSAFLVAIAALAASALFGPAAAQAPSERFVEAQKRSEATAAAVDSHHTKLRRRAADGCVVVTLVGADFRPYRCARIDSLVPIATRCGPNPYASPVAIFEALAEVDLTIAVLNADRLVVATAGFDHVAEGPYAVTISGDCLMSPTYWVQLQHDGRVVDEVLTMRSFESSGASGEP